MHGLQDGRSLRCGRFRNGATVIPLYVIGLAQWVGSQTLKTGNRVTLYMYGHCLQNGKSWRWQNLSMQNEGLQSLQEAGDELHGGQSFCQDVRRAVQWLRVYAACCLHLVPQVNGPLCHSLHRHLCRVALPPLGGICAKTSCGIWLPCDFGWPGKNPRW